MLTFDSGSLAKHDRADAISAVMSDASMASHVVLGDPKPDVYMRMHQWQLGSMTLVKMAISSVTVARTRRQTARDDVPYISVGIMCASDGAQIQDDETIPLGPATVYGIEMTRPYQHVSKGHTRVLAVLVPAADVGLPLERVAHARARIDSSPLRQLFFEHVTTLAGQADQVADLPTARMIEPATLHLTRALMASAQDKRAYVDEALADTLLARVKAFIREHLQDRNLNAAMIAAAHHVSQRHLYKVCATNGLRLESWIISQRLEATRVDLAKPNGRRLTIAAVAAKWGFSNASHFTHRFREAYGMTPREWQHLTNRHEPG